MLRLIAVALLTLLARALFGGVPNTAFSKSGVVFDGSLGNHKSGLAPFTSSKGMINYMIPACYGTPNNGTLFQSFSQFSLASSPVMESATFAVPSNIQNILARVTGGSLSSIDGTINCQGANLFFLNPAGVVFGPNAQLNVSGSVAITTADYLKLVGGARFNATIGPQDNMLTSAPVSAFGFLNSSPGGVSINGNNTLDSDGNTIYRPVLNVAPGKSFSIVAGEITMNGGEIATANNTIADEGPGVNLISVRSKGEAQLDATDFNNPVDVTKFSTMGDIQLTNSAFIDTSGLVSGPVCIRGANFRLDNSAISAQSYFYYEGGSVFPASNVGGTIDIVATESVKITNSAYISTFAASSIFPGNILVCAPSIVIDGSDVGTGASDMSPAGNITLEARGGDLKICQSSINTDFGPGSGGGGEVQLVAKNISLENVVIQSSAFDVGTGGLCVQATNQLIISDSTIDETAGYYTTGGDITLYAGSLLKIDGCQISSDNGPGSGFAGSSVKVSAGHLLQIVDSNIDTSTDSLNGGSAGAISLTAKSITVDTSMISSESDDYDFENPGNGAGGSIVVTAKSFSLQNQSSILAESYSPAPAGFIQLGSAQSPMGTLSINSGSSISSSTFGSGNGGNVDVVAGSILIDGASASQSSTGIFALAGDGSSTVGGNITVNAMSMLLQNGGTVSAASSTSAAAGSVHLGSVQSPLGTLSIDSGSSISSANSGSGVAGSVAIVTTGPTQLSGGSSVSTSAHGGTAGDVTVQTGGLGITQGAEISSSTFGEGVGGNVNVTADSVVIDGAGASEFTTGIFAVAGVGSSTVGGNITINAVSISLQNEATVSAASSTSAAAGSVRLGSVQSPLGALSIDSGSSISSANTGTGAAGSVAIDTTGPMALTGGSSISTSAVSRNAGEVAVQTTDLAIADGSEISSSTSGSGNGGSVSVFANSLSIDEGGSNLFTGITAEAADGSSGNAGSVMVKTADLTITAGAEISSNTFGQGNGGNVNVTANSVLINGAGRSGFSTGIFATAQSGSSGIGGDVAVNAGSLSLQNGGAVSAESSTAFAAGSVQLNVGALRMNSGSLISSANTGSGPGGANKNTDDAVFIHATGPVKLSDGSGISSSSKLLNAGNIELISNGGIELTSGSSIKASAGTSGGNIKITAPNLVYLLDSSINATAGTQLGAGGHGGAGGNITIEPQFIILNNSPISANAAAGKGGDIKLISSFFFNSNSLITATGTTSSGTVSITAPQLDLGAELITLPDSLVSAASQLQERCTALLQGDFSSFISIGRGGTEPEPDELESGF